MRLMLGTPGHPSLLVNVEDNFAPALFKFRVINGAWDGVMTNGHVTVLGIPGGGDYSDLGITHILSEDQDRLRGDYNTVFYNFDNPAYVAPKPKEFAFPVYWDDDIAF
jgi:hypothetical protein